jgi:hypothetical protein
LLTFLFGIIVPIIYAIVNRKHKATKQYKFKNVFLVLSIILIILSYSGAICYNLSYAGEFGHILDPEISFDESSTVTFKNNWGRKVILDKKGNEYIYSQRSNLLYFDRNGGSYKCIDDVWSTLKNTENQCVYTELEYDFYIDDEGYLCFFDNLYELNQYENDVCPVYYDEHLYFPIDVVSWDKEGNVVFSEYINELNNLTYDIVLLILGRLYACSFSLLSIFPYAIISLLVLSFMLKL